MSLDDTSLPRQFGPYLLKKKIARGGMAELYLGETSGPGGFKKPVVVKMIHEQFSEDRRFLSMFTDEAKIVADLAHGNIVPIFDFGTVDGRLYLAMEFIDGVDVSTLIDTCRVQGLALPLDVTLWIGIGAAAGLSHAHQATDRENTPLNIVHRDVSPHNILVSRSGEVKLCDFGIAVSAATEGQTDAGVIKGKLRYLSPEQARGEALDVRSDIFSLGVVLYELLTGTHPVSSGGDVVVMHTLSGTEGYRPLEEAAVWLPRSVSQTIDRAIAFDPQERFQTAETLHSGLSQLLYARFPAFTPKRLADLVCQVQRINEKTSSRDAESIIRADLASFASAVRHSTAPPTKAKRSPHLRAALVAVVVLAGIGLLGWLFSESTGEPAPPKAPPLERPLPPVSPDTAPEPPPVREPPADAEPAQSPIQTPAAPTEPPAAADRPPKRPGQGRVDINADPWAEVTIGGTERGTTPIIGLKLPAGRHRAVFTNPETGVTKTRTVRVRAGKTTRVIVEMSDRQPDPPH